MFHEFILELRPRSIECMYIYLQPTYEAEIRFESRGSKRTSVSGNIRSPQGNVVGKITPDDDPTVGYMKIGGLPAGHYQLCAYNFQGLGHFVQLEVEIYIDHTDEERKRFSQSVLDILKEERANNITKEEVEQEIAFMEQGLTKTLNPRKYISFS